MTAGDNENIVKFSPRSEHERRDAKMPLDEGLRLLAAFKMIEDPTARALLTNLAEALAKQARS